jgi:hypothetical protein
MLRGMFQSEELARDEPFVWSLGRSTEVRDLFCACAAGDLERPLTDANPSLVRLCWWENGAA